MNQPLDKSAAFIYGLLVNAAYSMFEHPAGDDPLRPEPAGIPPEFELGAWIHMSDFILGDEELKFYGIVVHRVDDPDSRIIAIRGTEGAIEWVDDATAILVPFHQVPSAGRVSAGFDKIYSTMKVIKHPLPGVSAPTNVVKSYSGSFAEQLEQLALEREAERGLTTPPGAARRPRPTVVTAHSLGSALATLFVMENGDKAKFDITTLCTFASPRVGNLEFVHLFNRTPITLWRLVNIRDVVPKVPFHIPVFFDYDHVNVEYSFDAAEFASKSLTCSHSMDTYLHWLDSSHPVLSECALPAAKV